MGLVRMETEDSRATSFKALKRNETVKPEFHTQQKYLSKSNGNTETCVGQGFCYSIIYHRRKLNQPTLDVHCPLTGEWLNKLYHTPTLESTVQLQYFRQGPFLTLCSKRKKKQVRMVFVFYVRPKTGEGWRKSVCSSSNGISRPWFS